MVNWNKINWDKINKKISVKNIIFPIMVVSLIFLSLIWGKIAYKHIQKSIFAGNMEEIISKNENPTFSVEKIYLCSSANAIDNTSEQKLDKLGLYQYTDIAVYLNNYKDNGLTEKNTLKKLYIDDISLDLDYNIGKPSLVYTNLLKMGSREELAQMISNSKNIQNDKIDFYIVSSNDENDVSDYEKPTFYADCSNPISLKYINEISAEYKVEKNSSATFDGSILGKVGIKPEDINARISFRINIVNNKDEYYSNYVSFQIPLNDINKGTTIKSKTTIGSEYNFFTI
ncbi:MAG: hypothetical protein IJK18_01495 [Clostridia bacterium]|nr:hypothetical protein [Clostridia bacterium]